MSDPRGQSGAAGASSVADRGVGVVLLALALFLAWGAWQMQVPFAYDPLGPKAFPLGVAALLAVLSLVLMIRPGPVTGLPRGATALKLLGVLGILALYAVMFTRLGYLVSSVMAMAVLARVFGASWVKAIVTGVVLALVSYGVFVYALNIVLPSGIWWGQ